MDTPSINKRAAYSQGYHASNTEKISKPIYEPSSDITKPAKIAHSLRVLGALAVVVSGMIYMLQGLHSSSTDIRYWAYCGLMALLGAGGIFSFRFMGDKIGARLFFALGALVVPIQFSQLGGMIFDHLGGFNPALHSWFEMNAANLDTIVITGIVSVLLGFATSFAAFSILSRSHAKALCLTYMLLNCLLLLPFRVSYETLLVLFASAALIFYLTRKYFSADVLFTTMEGAFAKSLLYFPVIIILVRCAFHISENAGISSLLVMGSLAAIGAHRVFMSELRVKEALLTLAYAVGVVGICGLSNEIAVATSLSADQSSSGLIIMCALPLVFWSAYFSRVSQGLAPYYRVLSVLSGMLIAAINILDGALEISLITFFLGALFSVWGMKERYLLPSLTGCGLCASAVCMLILSSLENVNFNIWLTLALGGFVLLAVSSFIEKHGRKWIAESSAKLSEFRQWDL